MVLLVLIISLFIALQTSAVQTLLAQKASDFLSKELKTKVSVGKVDIDFVKTLVLKDIYIEDQHRDTLIYGAQISCNLSDFSYKQKKLIIQLIKLKNVHTNLITYKGEKKLNLQFLIDYFSPKDSIKDTTAGFDIKYGDLVLDNANFRYQNQNDTSQTRGMNYSDLDITKVSGKITNLKIEKDTIRANIVDLSARDKCGFYLKSLSAMAVVSPAGVVLDSLLLKTDKTYIHGSYAMLTNSWDSYPDYIDKVYMKANLKDSTHVNASDIAYFVPAMKGINECVFLSGKVRGTVSALHGDDIKLKYREDTQYEGDFSIEGLPVIEDTYLHFEIDNLTTSRKDLIQIPVPPFNQANKLSIPENLDKLGLVKYKGKIDGFINDIAAYGTLKTAIGSVSTDLGLSQLNDKKLKLAYHGRIKTTNFKLGELLDNKAIGAVTLDAAVNGKGVDLDALEANMEGNIEALTYNGYTYKSIKLTGDFKKKLFSGKFESRDENANIDFYGSASFVSKIPDLDFIATINRIDFSKLNFFKMDTTSDFSSQIAINLKGDNIDNISGRINLDNTIYKVKGKEYRLSVFDLLLDQSTANKSIKMNSGVADVKLDGQFNLSDLGNAVQQYLANYFPTFIRPAKNANKRYYDNVAFMVKVKKFNTINGLFMPDLMLSPNTLLEGRFDASKNILEAKGSSDKIQYGSTIVKNWKLNCSTLDNGISISTGADKINFTDSTFVGNLLVTAQGYDNKSGFTINWDNQSKQKNSGAIKGDILFTRQSLEVDLEKFGIYVADSLWTMKGEDRFNMDSSGLFNFNELVFVNGLQSIKLRGLISKNPKDQLEVEFENFQLSQLNPLLGQLNMSLSGTVSGKSNVSDVYHNVIFSSALDFSKLYINNKVIGSGQVKSNYDKSKEVISLMGHFKKEYSSLAGALSFNNIEFNGYYYPTRKENNIDIDCALQSIDLSVVQPFVKGILTIGKGSVSGKAKVSGSVNKPLLNGKLSIDSKNLKVDYLNTYYTMSGELLIEPDRFALEGVHLTDINGNSAVVWGNVFHDNFKNIKLDFDINTTKFMCLNTTFIQNPAYYGKAFVTGTVGIYGSPENMSMEINVKTEKGTQFNIPLSGPAEIGDHDFIHFVKQDTIKSTANEKNDLSGLSLKFQLEATPDAEIQLIFDEKAGDVIKARGRGNIGMNIDTKGSFEMFGLYTITDGNYLFTLENFINKKFDIENGSTIKWSGDPYNAEINITANYKQRASLAPFFPTAQTTDNSSGTAGSVTSTTSSASTSGVDTKKRYPVDCQLYMRNKLLNPEITFGIALPTVNETVRQQVMSYINTEQELNRQVFSLLLLKSFVTPLALSNQSGVSAGGAVSSNATEMLSNQLNNWLSQISKRVDMGVNYRPGNALSNEELDLALSTQLFNDKLSVDGNVGVNNNTQAKTSSMIGDLNVDYKVRDDGKVRVKAFNRSNDTYQTTTQGGQFTQGVGIFFREEFDSWPELYKRYLAKLKHSKKDETEKPPEPDDAKDVNIETP